MVMEQKIETEFIKLESLLKLTAVCSSGGEAKMLIQNEQVLVNGELCTQRGKKIRPGDQVTIQDMQIKII